MIAFCIGPSSCLYSQSTATADTSVRSTSPRFLVEGTANFVLFNARQNVNFIERNLRALQGSFEAGMLFPIDNSTTSLYVGVQGAIFSWGQGHGEERQAYPVWALVPGGTPNVQQAILTTDMIGRWTVNAGLSTNLGWLHSRSTVGFGALYSNMHYKIDGSTRSEVEANVAVTIRQSFTRDIGMFYIGGQFEQTFSYWNNFSAFGIVTGIRW
jgi:hypothetical protein